MENRIINLEKLNQQIGLKDNLQTPAGIISTLLPIILSLTGIILLVMIIVSGFSFVFSATNPDQAEKAKKTLTSSIIGFIIIFAVYWIAQILEIIFAFPIVSGN